MNESPAERDPVEVLAEDFRARLQRGERPDVEEYARRRPDLAGPIRDLFPAVAALAASVAVLLAGGTVAALAAAVHAGSLARQERLARDEALREQNQAQDDLQQAEAQRTVRDGHVALGRWPEAARVGAEAVATDPTDVWSLHLLPPLLLETGDREGHVKSCRQLLERFGTTDDPIMAERTAKACLLAPDGVADLRTLPRLATRAVTGTEKHGFSRWFILCKGLADIREAGYARSLAELKGLNPGPNGTDFDATVYVLMAMAHQGLAQPAEARQALQRAREIMEQKMPRPERGQLFGSGWDNWLRCGILLREAESLLRSQSDKRE